MWVDGLLRRKGRLAIGNDQQLRQKILQLMHNFAMGGYSGVQATVKRTKLLFYWRGIEKDVRNFIRNCAICQTCKPENVKVPGLLQP